MSNKNKSQTVRKAQEVDDENEDDSIVGHAFKWSLLVILIVGSAIAGGIWYSKQKPPEKKVEAQKEQGAKVREKVSMELPGVLFTDITSEAGINFSHFNGAEGEKLLPETMGGGAAFFDYDNDGNIDVIFINSSPWPDSKNTAKPTMKLYHGDGKGHFADVTAGSGFDVTFYGQGVAVGDYDNDGLVDVFISAVYGNHLYKNKGNGKFEEVTKSAGVGGLPDAWCTSAAFLDFDNDGKLDLYVCNYVTWSKQTDIVQGFKLVGVGRAYGPPTAFAGAFSYLYHNDGDGKFSDVSAKAGIQRKNPATGKPMGKSLGVLPVDLDRDGWIDIVVANDTVQNFLFHNRRDGTFEEIGAESGMAFDSAGQARGAMGCDAGYFRNDNQIAVSVGNFSNEMNALYVGDGRNLQFRDDAIATGIGPVTRQFLTFGLFFFDPDLDGRLDLFTCNGHLENEINRVNSSQTYKQPPQLIWNCGPKATVEFEPLKKEQCGESLFTPIVGRGAAYADIDNDGDLDVLLVQNNGPCRLLRNDQKLLHHYLRLKLTGTKANRDAIGSWVEVKAGGNMYVRQVMPSRSYLSQVELPVTIGLGKADKIDSVTVYWPDGSKQVVEGAKIDGLTAVMQQK